MQTQRACGAKVGRYIGGVYLRTLVGSRQPLPPPDRPPLLLNLLFSSELVRENSCRRLPGLLRLSSSRVSGAYVRKSSVRPLRGGVSGSLAPPSDIETRTSAAAAGDATHLLAACVRASSLLRFSRMKIARTAGMCVC